ncbi:MAG: ATPase RavA [Syntrophorhabdus sp. PtaU1.Bin050]|nr:MAG: ATPase RavA [Syntrophorhabdus sp. PtaU1.Bin050]
MQKFQERIAALSANIEKVIVGKKNVVDLALVTLLCRGHLLLEDVPGLGKTMLARSIAGSLALQFKRVQFTPDLLPSDITGVSIYSQKTGEFEFKAGPIFTNILLADEINRASPRTQSSLLESMEERQATIDGVTYRLPGIFMVIATQNPIELQGTYPLPEAQLDRFFMRLSMGYPSPEQETEIMSMQIKEHPIYSVQSVLSGDELSSLQDTVSQVFLEKSVMDYIVKIVNATRTHADLVLGASLRGSLSLMRAAQAMAVLRDMEYVEPSMVKAVAGPVLAHRIIVKPQAKLRGVTEDKIIGDIMTAVPVPVM